MTWVEGVFLASNTVEPKPSTIALIKRLTNQASVSQAPESQAAR